MYYIKKNRDKKTKLKLIIFLIPIFSYAQNIGNQFEANFKLIGFDLEYEYNVYKNFNIKFGAGLDGGIFKKYGNDKINSIFTDFYVLGAKYYYNTNRRLSRGKSIKNNSANYIALDFKGRPDIFTFANSKDKKIQKSLFIVPKYGFQRNLGRNFILDLAGGLGYALWEDSKNGMVIDVEIKIGYVF